MVLNELSPTFICEATRDATRNLIETFTVAPFGNSIHIRGDTIRKDSQDLVGLCTR